jgi:predicted AAA+ superfamily ATPase
MSYKRLLHAPDKSFFLMGPRGTGKSTWIRETFPEAKVFNLLSEESYLRYMREPGAFASELRAIAPGSRVVVDEVQRLPGLLNEVHRFIEERELRFVLCGSSARKLKRAGVNLLAGRALHRAMHPFVPAELGEDFDLNRAMTTGLIPIVWGSDEPGETLAAYAHMYLREEIQAEALVRNLPGFARFLPISTLFHGQTMNVSNIAREAGVARTTVNDYLSILQETLLAFEIPAYQAKLRVRERCLPKFYFCDPGLVHALRATGTSTPPEVSGALFEGLVAQLLRAYRDLSKAFDEIYYWASSSAGDVEVDFLLRHQDAFVAIEVKSGRTLQPKWCAGLRAVQPLPGLRRRYLVMPEIPRMTLPDGVEVLSFLDLASMLANHSLFEG